MDLRIFSFFFNINSDDKTISIPKVISLSKSWRRRLGDFAQDWNFTHVTLESRGEFRPRHLLLVTYQNVTKLHLIIEIVEVYGLYFDLNQNSTY